MAVSDLPKLKEVIINGVDVSAYVMSFTVEDDDDKTVVRSKIALKKTVNAVLDYTDSSLIGDIVTVKRGVVLATEQFLFKGYLRNIDFEGGYVSVSCEDMLSEAKYTIVNTSYDVNVGSEAGVVSDIAKNLINENLSIVASALSVQDSGTINIIRKIVFRQKILMDALEELAYLIDWQFYYDPTTDLVYFEPKGYVSSTEVLSTTTNVVKLPKWDINSSQLFNRIIIKGAQQEIFTEVGPYRLDGSQTGWDTDGITLEKKPIFTQVFSDTGATPTTEKVGGVASSSSSYDYEIDTERKLLEFSSSFNPSTSYYASVKFSYNIPIQVVRKNATSITAYGMKSISQFREQIKTMSDAEDWAATQLQMYSEPFFKTTLNIRGINDLKTGVIHTVDDSINNINRQLMVKKIMFMYPYRYDVAEVADKEWRTSNWGVDTRQRLKVLEEKQADNDDLLNNVIDVDRTMDYERRYVKLDKFGIDTTIGIYGNAFYGQYGTSKYGANDRTYQELRKLVQHENTYEEYFEDDDFFNIDSNCEAYYNFENSSSVVDSTGNHSAATVDGATFSTGGKLGNCYSFDGANDFINTGFSTHGVRSISLWYYHQTPTGSNNQRLLVGKTSSINPSLNWHENNQQPRLMDNTGVQIAGPFLSPNNWYHIIGVYDGSDSRIYVNGVRRVTGTLNTTALDNSQNFDIGGGTTGRYIQGKMDEVGLWTSQLTDSDAKELYNAGRGSSPIFGSTLDASNKILTLGAYQSAISKEIALGTDFTYYTVSTGTTTGTYSIEISHDNGETFQTVIEDSRTAFTSNGGSVIYKITETGGSTTTFQPTYDIGGELNLPGVKIILEE